MQFKRQACVLTDCHIMNSMVVAIFTSLHLMSLILSSILCTLSRLSSQPKVPPTCLEIIKTGMTMFSAQPFPVKEVIAAMGPVLNGTNGLFVSTYLALPFLLLSYSY